MLTNKDIQDIVSVITYKPGWQILLRFDETRPYVQIQATTMDSITHELVPWRSAKHYLSYHMCRQEVVSSVFHAIERAELHEIREFFRYKGASIYNPHLDPDVLAEVAKKATSFCLRENAMLMTERD
jgi:hypothetical protein